MEKTKRVTGGKLLMLFVLIFLLNIHYSIFGFKNQMASFHVMVKKRFLNRINKQIPNKSFIFGISLLFRVFLADIGPG